MRMRRLLPLLILVVLALTISSCASTSKGRYYQNLDMYTFVMKEFRTQYAASTAIEQEEMDLDILPLLDAWAKARHVWKLSMNDATKEQAAMAAWSEARTALITYGIVTIEEVQ